MRVCVFPLIILCTIICNTCTWIPRALPGVFRSFNHSGSVAAFMS